MGKLKSRLILVKKIKKYIELNLEEKIRGITLDRSKIGLLSKRDLISIVNFMIRKRIYSVCLLEYIYTKSIYRHDPENYLPPLHDGIFIDECQRGNITLVKLLLSDEIRRLHPKDLIDPSSYNNLAIRCASAHGNIEIVKYLLSDEIRKLYPRIDPSAYNNSAIMSACETGHIEVVKFLLSSEVVRLYPKIDPSRGQNYCLRQASLWGRTKVVKFLLSKEITELYPNINPGFNHNFPIRTASTHNHHKIVKFLLSNDIVGKYPQIDPSEENNYSIRWAIEYKYTEIVKLLLQDQRVIDKGLDDLIELAKKCDQPEIVDLLLSINKN
jgi:ankyrin repeat protein